MESRTWTLPTEKIEAEAELRAHFGWVPLTTTPTTLTMKREDSSVVKQLRSLEKQYDYLNRKAPIGGIVWLIIGVLFLIITLALFGKSIDWLFIMFSGISFAFGIALVIGFLIMLPYKKKLIARLLEEGNELLGVKKTLPIPTNLKKGDINSYAIKKAVYNGELNID